MAWISAQTYKSNSEPPAVKAAAGSTATSKPGSTPAAAAAPRTSAAPPTGTAPDDPKRATPPPPPPAAPNGNSAVHRCVAAYRQAQTAAGGPKTPGARDAAEHAFREALPDPTDRASAADFIACILKGMLLRVFWKEEGPRLLSGARTLLAALPRDRAEPQTPRMPSGRPKKSPALW